MTLRPPRLITRTALVLSPLLLIGCAGSYEHEEVVQVDEGRVVIKRVKDPAPPMVEARAMPTGPTTREIDQQRRIDQLEAQSKAMQDEIARLKREQANTPK